MNKLLYAIPSVLLLLTSASIMAFAEQVNQSDEKSNQEKAKDIEAQKQDGTTQKSKVDELTKQEFKDDIKELLGDIDAEQYKIKSDEIKAEYDQFFDTVIEQARVDSKTRTLSDAEIVGAKGYIFAETIKDEKHKALHEQNHTSNIHVSFLEWLGIQTASAVCPDTTNPNYQQMKIDVDGGTFGSYTFNGDNDLYLASYTDNSVTCERTFTLYFYDEDHPYLDAVYDNIRQILYGRTHDIEMFSIKNNSQIKFDNTWSSSNDFDCLDYLQRGCHETKTKSYTVGQTVYVSNTWNHMMDTSDTNSQYSKVTVP